MRHLILVLGDQLSDRLPALRQADKVKDRILIAEVMAEATYVRHHKKKIAFLFSAMRHFADALRADGWRVDYVELGANGNSGSLTGELERAAARLKPARVCVTEPGEWRLREAMQRWEAQLGVPVDILEDTRFICSHDEFGAWAKGKKQLRMEFFYREMRRKTGLLMDGDKPAGGQWNFDSDNRKPAKGGLFTPKPSRFTPDDVTLDVLALVEERFADHFGDLEPFWFAVTAKDAARAMKHFMQEALPLFGDYQDAMLANEKFLYHSILSLYINAGLLDPLEVCRAAEAEWRAGRVPLNAAEGFIRQIIGWREYVRGIYWMHMPGYDKRNFLGAKRALPEFYWTGETGMVCLASAITQTKQEAYAHHIQRLMVTGNFAMLAGIDPHALHEWYLAVYVDAYEWVELPNTLGMSQFADGGVLASKPYAGSGNYINKMSDYCGACAYKVGEKTGEQACPLNALYWDFLARHESRLKGNPRLGPVYRSWEKMGQAKQAETRASARRFLTKLDKGERV